MDRYLGVLKKYAVFDGRARRTEYWMFFLFNFLIGMTLGILDTVIGFIFPLGWLFVSFSWIYSLGVFVPSLAVGVRRLHDTGRSGWWLLFGLIPLIGAIILLIFFVEDSQPGSNQYGPNPKGLVGPNNSYRSDGALNYCRSCGTRVPTGAAYCQKCGAKIS